MYPAKQAVDLIRHNVHPLSVVGSLFLMDGLDCWVYVEFMTSDLGINPRHVHEGPGKNILDPP